MEHDRRLAVLIDAENVSPRFVKDIFEEAVNHGAATVRRIYGDWTSHAVNAWKDTLLNYSITAMQQYRYTSGKNSSDSAMIIDAMDLLYSNNLDGFCLVSSDSDFTRLAVRLRESGMYVVGMGERKTPDPFVKSCVVFVFLETIADEQTVKPGKSSNADIKTLIREIEKILDENSDENGYMLLSQLPLFLRKLHPEFNPRNYGYKKMLTLIESLGKFEVDYRDSTDPKVKIHYIRKKD